LTLGTSGTGISGSATFSADTASNVTFTVTSNATSSNGALSIVARDASGNFTANNITANGDVTSSSDERLKTDWRAVVDDFVEKLANVKSGVYTRIDTGETQIGASAQSLASVLPEATKVDESGMMSIAYGQAALVATVELAKYVVELKKEIELLKAK
jgi:cell division protein FtsI/penicillin-binding protein 2